MKDKVELDEETSDIESTTKLTLNGIRLCFLLSSIFFTPY